MKRSTIKSDPAKIRSWQQRSRKPLKASGFIRNSPLRSSKPDPHRKASPARIGRQGVQGAKRQGISSKPDPKLAAWGRAVRKRDGNKCRFPEGCASGDSRIDPHHIATRGRRPDLIYDERNGICLCRRHHDWVHDNPMQAERMGLLNFDSYELAQKIKAGYVVPGDEDDHRVTL